MFYRLTTKGYVGTFDIAQAGDRSMYLLWGECGDAVAGGKEDTVILWDIYPRVGNEFPVNQPGTADMADPLPVSSTIMPDAHCRGTPDVARTVLDDVADCEAAKSLGIGKPLNHTSAATPDEQTLHCAYQHVALRCLTKALAALAL